MLLFIALACRPNDGGGKDRVIDTGVPDDTQVDPVDTGEELHCEDLPQAGNVVTLTDCEYEPAPSGNPFDATVEWAMTHQLVDPSTGAVVPAYDFAVEPELRAVFQSPAVGQATDDNSDGLLDGADVPDIAVNMGDEFGAEVSEGGHPINTGESTRRVEQRNKRNEWN